MKNLTFPATQTNRVLVLMVAVVLVLLVAMMVPQLAWADHDPVHQDELTEAQRERALEAYTARWVAMGEFYAKSAEAQRARAMEAYTARWVAMGEWYAKSAEAQRARALEAYTARWVAMGEFYAGLSSLSEVDCQAEGC
jgi:hypothetical protein